MIGRISISHQMGDFILSADIALRAGVTVLFGRSGAGKSTLANAVAGLLRPDAGVIELNGQTMFDSAKNINIPANARRIGYVFQDGRLFPHMTVRQNLRFAMDYAHTRPTDAQMAAIVEMLGIGPLLVRKPATLSGGEKQRVAIGRALLNDPQMLIMDEPLAALDQARKDEILPYLERLRDKTQLPILYVSHSMAEVARLADQIAILKNGTVMAHDATEVILSNAALMQTIGVREAGSIIIAPVAAHLPEGLTCLDLGGPLLTVPRVNAPVGHRVRTRIMAQDIIIATQRPQNLSALNVLEATVDAVQIGDDLGAAVTLQIGAHKLLARVTKRSVTDLNISVGDQIFAIFKATTVSRSNIGL